jgi:phenylalanyl-tRNA synthetase beta chain
VKFTLSWLKDHLETDAGAAEVAVALTRIGLEVESIQDPGEALASFRVARVLSAERHPQADKLQVLSVDAGDGPLQVVCGAPNARAGLVGVFGAPGTHVPGLDVTLKVAAIRGVESNGMMCSARELMIGEGHDGIIELPADAPIGESFARFAGLNDPVFDLSVTPNRQDCMGVRGIARDLAAAGLGTLRPWRPGQMPAAQAAGGSGDGSAQTDAPPAPEVRIEDAEGCPAFFAQAVAGLRNGEAPDWMRGRLRAIGQKPISALVDITNYVMFDLGRPLHVYDRAKLAGALVARKAIDGEQVLALNGRSYTLNEGVTVIADQTAVHDIGGIMGGAESGVSPDTTDVLIECAYFDPDTIARTGQGLALTSDARQRFERGVDPAFLDDGLAHAAQLILALCGGQVSGVTRAGEPPIEPRVLHYDPALARSLGGLDVTPERQRAVLESLGFEVDERWRVTVPSWRRDVDGVANLVSEVIRMEGIDRVPAAPLPRLPGVAAPTATPAQRIERRARRAAAALGLNEAVTWSFIPEEVALAFGGAAWVLANPISEELKAMRPSLLPGLLAAARRNADRGAASIRLFEIGRRYLPDAERQTLGLVLAGERAERSWASGKAQPFDAFDAKAQALAIFGALALPTDRLQLLPADGPVWHPGRAGRLALGPKQVLACFGELHPALVRQSGLSGTVVAAELFLDALPTRRETGRMRPAYAPPPLQAVTRDFAFVVPEAVAAEALVRAIRAADKGAIVDARVFDRFVGGDVPSGQVSLAVEVTLQPEARSFTDADLQAIAARIVAAAARLGAALRS